MAEAKTYTEQQWHRKCGVDLYNHTWTLIEKAGRTPEEDDEMLQAAYTSRYHWSRVGGPVEFARSAWQLSHVYALLKRADQALYHAERCLQLCEANSIGDFDLAFAYEALTRAHAVAGNAEARAHYLELAKSAGAQIKEADDRDIFFDQLAAM